MIRTKVSHILELYDGYTGQRADARQFQVEAEPDVLWRRKDAGCIAFLDCWERAAEIKLNSRIYQSKKAILPENGRSDSLSFSRIWVFPDAGYRGDWEEVCQKKEADPGKTACYFPVRPDNFYRLKKDVEPRDHHICIAHKEKEVLSGREILLYPQKIRLTLGEETDVSGSFYLEHPVGETVKKSETAAYLGYEGTTGADGSCRIAFPNAGGETRAGVLYINNNGKEMEVETSV